MMIFNELNITTVEDRPSYHNITPDLLSFIEKSGVRNGVLTVTSPHTTCSLFFEENMHDLDEAGDEFLQRDFNKILDQIVPKQSEAKKYHSPGPKHIEFGLSLADSNYPAEEWVMYNSDAHIRATIFGQFSLQVIIKDSKPLLGALGRIYFVDWDTLRKRERKVNMATMGAA